MKTKMIVKIVKFFKLNNFNFIFYILYFLFLFKDCFRQEEPQLTRT